MNYCGIDPGLSGAIALIDESGRVLELHDMPTLKTIKSRHEIDAHALLGLVEDITFHRGQWRCVLENPGIRPGQGASSGLKIGVGWGIIYALLVAEGTPVERVSPQRWQRAVLGRVEKGTMKARRRALAQDLFPGADLGKRKSEDRSDALLMAWHGLKAERGTG